MWIVIAFALPVILVLGMNLVRRFDGWKTNTQGIVIAVIGSVQFMDLTFLTKELSAALIAGAGVAVLIASKTMTKREK